jgi:short-subunit dehydrogenase
VHVLLTGASSGIGAGLAAVLGAAGHTLTLVARRQEQLQEVAAGIPTPSHLLVRDLTDLDAVDALVADAEALGGPVEMLVNNAGIELLCPTPGADVAAAGRLLRLNLEVPLRLTSQVLPSMLARDAGVIVDIASVAALGSQPYGTWYAASKSGLAAAGRQLRWELRRTGVHVLTVYPGPIHTEMGQRAYRRYTADPTAALLPWGTTGELGRRILRAVQRRQGELIYPRPYAVAAIFPRIIDYFGRFNNIALADGE